MSKNTHPEFVVSKDNYKGRDTNLDLINLTLNFHPDPSANPLWLRDGLTDFISEQLAFHVNGGDFDLHDIAEVMALAAEQSLRDMNLNRYPYTGNNY